MLLVSLVSLICHTPFVIKGQHVNWSSFSQRNVRNNRSWCAPFIISEQMLVQWWRLVAYIKATNLLHRAKRTIVPPHRDGHQNGQQRWYIVHCCFVDCCHGGHWGNTEQVVAQWQRPVASDLAIDMLHWVMPHAPLQHFRTDIKMACNGGLLLIVADILFDTTCS